MEWYVNDEGGVPANVNGSQGIVAGSGNTQINNWQPKQPLDLVALSQLSPYVVLTRLEGVPHDDLVDFFAKASPGDTAEVLRIFLEADEPKGVAILADINPRKSADLIASVAALAKPSSWLKLLPVATEEIARKAVELKWAYQGNRGHLERKGPWYVRRYGNGRVYWHASYGTHGVSEAIGACFTADEFYNLRRTTETFPAGDEEAAPPSPYGTNGISQSFVDGTKIYSSKFGTFALRGLNRDTYEDEGGSAGWLGFPTDSFAWEVESDGLQCFEGGVVCEHSRFQNKSFAVRRAVRGTLADLRRHLIESRPLRGCSFVDAYPVSKETPAAASAYGYPGSFQDFQCEWNLHLHMRSFIQRSDQPGVVEEITEYEPPPLRFSVYISKIYRPQIIPHKILEYYRAMGAEASWLGYPVTSGYPFDDPGIQYFEGGLIFWRDGAVPISIRRARKDVRSQDHSDLGYLVTEEEFIGDGSDRIQFFEHGTVILRDGKREIWPCPD